MVKLQSYNRILKLFTDQQLVNYLLRPSYSTLERPMEGGEPVTVSHQFVLLRINSLVSMSSYSLPTCPTSSVFYFSGALVST